MKLTTQGYRDIGLEFWLLAESGAFDRAGCELADKHYSRRKPGAPQFMPPGQRFVLISPRLDAVWGWWRPHPSAGIAPMNGLDGWTCTIFRNTNLLNLSSALVLDAERAVGALGFACGPDGLLTYVWDAKIRSTNPGYCFKRAGWTKHPKKPRSADNKKTLLWKPFALAGVAPPLTAPRCSICDRGLSADGHCRTEACPRFDEAQDSDTNTAQPMPTATEPKPK